MKIQQSQSSYQRPNFKGILYQLPTDLPSGSLAYLQIMAKLSASGVSRGSHCSTKLDRGFFAVWDSAADAARQILDALGVKGLRVPDEELTRYDNKCGGPCSFGLLFDKLTKK